MNYELFSDEYFMNEALKEAQDAFRKGEIPVGAVIVANRQIIARAHNLTETLGDVTAHAEMQAFTSASEAIGGKYLNECTLYVTLEPCTMCAGAAYWAQLGKLVYGADDEKKGFTNVSRSILHPKTDILTGILENECAALLREFFLNKRKKIR
jgi:tRNA(adenine34) deaminase